MGKNPESMLKGAMALCIAEEIFRDLGFFVLKLGQENTVSPMTQLQEFITACGGKFSLVRNEFGEDSGTSIRKLPDFVIISKTGKVKLLEVKYRKNATLSGEDISFLRLFPDCALLVVNSTVGIPTDGGLTFTADEEALKEREKTRFHIITGENIEENETEEKTELAIEANGRSLSAWLKEEFTVEQSGIVEKYEKLVDKWFSPSEGTIQ